MGVGFPSRLHRQLQALGFVKAKLGVMRDFEDARVILLGSKSKKSLVLNLTIGVWLKALDGVPPTEHQLCHIYGDCAELIPSFSSIISELWRSETAQVELLDRTVIFVDLVSRATTIRELSAALTEGRLKGLLVRKEAREFLLSRRNAFNS